MNLFSPRTAVSTDQHRRGRGENKNNRPGYRLRKWLNRKGEGIINYRRPADILVAEISPWKAQQMKTIECPEGE